MNRIVMVLGISSTFILNGCGSDGASSSDSGSATTSTGENTATSLASGYRLAKWQSGVNVNFKDNCTMTFTSNGIPSHGLSAYYLVPGNTNVVATTPVGHLNLVVATLPSSASETTYTFNICPQAQSSATTTGGGAIGWMISGSALFNAYEGDMITVANADNVSYSFSDANGKSQTAKFLDDCGGHNTPAVGGNQYHYHGYSTCLTVAAGDTETGPSHLIGVANDGYPIYNDRDLNGNLVDVATLDSCNGINSATPEFPNGVYHYVLPSGNTRNTTQATPRCLKGKVPAQLKIDIALKSGNCVTRFDSNPTQVAMLVSTKNTIN